MEPEHLAPCPWLIAERGAILPTRPRSPDRCGADPQQPPIPNRVRVERCLAAGPCPVREAHERRLGPLADALAPRLPVGAEHELPLPDTARPARPVRWRLLAVAAGATLLAVALSGPLLDRLAGGAEGPEPSGSVAASDEPVPSPTPSPTPSDTPSASPSASVSPEPSPSASPWSGRTWVVKSGDTLYDIGLQAGVPYLQIAKLNGISAPYTISPGQVLKLP